MSIILSYKNVGRILLNCLFSNKEALKSLNGNSLCESLWQWRGAQSSRISVVWQGQIDSLNVNDQNMYKKSFGKISKINGFNGEERRSTFSLFSSFFFHTYLKISELPYFWERKPMDKNSIIFSEAVRHCLLGSLSWYLHNTWEIKPEKPTWDLASGEGRQDNSPVCWASWWSMWS